jgi:hypothetical protein
VSTITEPLSQSPLYRTMWRSIMHATGNTETADAVMVSIIDSHPHLSEVWDANTCRACKAILRGVDKALDSPYCECCRMDPRITRTRVLRCEVMKMYGGE